MFEGTVITFRQVDTYLRKDQYRYLYQLQRWMELQQWREVHQERPQVPVREAKKEWWRYFLRLMAGVKPESRRDERRWDFQRIEGLSEARKYYMDTYKKYKTLEDSDKKDARKQLEEVDKLLKRLEERFTFEQVMYFRYMAYLQIQEKKEKQAQHKADQKQSSGIWSFIFGGSGGKQAAGEESKSQDEGRLTTEMERQLYGAGDFEEMMAMARVDEHFVMFQASLDLQQFQVHLINSKGPFFLLLASGSAEFKKTRTSWVATTMLADLSARDFRKEKSGDLILRRRHGNISVEEAATKLYDHALTLSAGDESKEQELHEASPISEHNPQLASLGVHWAPHEGCDLRVEGVVEPMELALTADLVHEVTQFILIQEGESLAERLAQQIVSLSQKAAASAHKAAESAKRLLRVEADISIATPLVLFPIDLSKFSSSADETGTIAISLGDFKVKNGPRSWLKREKEEAKGRSSTEDHDGSMHALSKSITASGEMHAKDEWNISMSNICVAYGVCGAKTHLEEEQKGPGSLSQRETSWYKKPATFIPLIAPTGFSVKLETGLHASSLLPRAVDVSAVLPKFECYFTPTFFKLAGALGSSFNQLTEATDVQHDTHSDAVSESSNPPRFDAEATSAFHFFEWSFEFTVGAFGIGIASMANFRDDSPRLETLDPDLLFLLSNSKLMAGSYRETRMFACSMDSFVAVDVYEKSEISPLVVTRLSTESKTGPGRLLSLSVLQHTGKAKSIEGRLDFSSLDIHWNASTFAGLVTYIRHCMKSLSLNPSKSLAAAAQTQPTVRSQAKIPIKFDFNLTSLTMYWNLDKIDKTLAELNVSSGKFLMQSDGEGMHFDGSLGNLTVRDAFSAEPVYQTLLGLSEVAGNSSLLSVQFATYEDDDKNSKLDVHMSPMRFVYVHNVWMRMFDYMLDDFLETALAFTSLEEKEEKKSHLEYSIAVDKPEVLIPESPWSKRYVAASLEQVKMTNEIMDISGSDDSTQPGLYDISRIACKNLSVRTHENKELCAQQPRLGVWFQRGLRVADPATERRLFVEMNDLR